MPAYGYRRVEAATWDLRVPQRLTWRDWSPSTCLAFGAFGLLLGHPVVDHPVVNALLLGAVGAFLDYAKRELKRRGVLPSDEPDPWVAIRVYGPDPDGSFVDLRVPSMPLEGDGLLVPSGDVSVGVHVDEVTEVSYREGVSWRPVVAVVKVSRLREGVASDQTGPDAWPTIHVLGLDGSDHVAGPTCLRVPHLPEEDDLLFVRVGESTLKVVRVDRVALATYGEGDPQPRTVASVTVVDADEAS